MTGRDARRMLRRAGFTHTRTGTHDVWAHPDGRMVTLPSSSNRDLYGNLAHKVRRYAEGGDTAYQRQEQRP